MKEFWTARIALGFAVVGVVLMALTIAWRINPVEGSVVPRFLTHNPIGIAIIWILLVTCIPVWIFAVSLSLLLPLSDRIQYLLACGWMLVFQAILYFLIGKLVSVCRRRLKRKNEASKQGVQVRR